MDIPHYPQEAKENVKQNHVSFHDFQQNGTTKQLTNGTGSSSNHSRKKSYRKRHTHNSLNKYRRLEIGNDAETGKSNFNPIERTTML